ncbi:hypothetical protein B0H63DRAFT_520765 [Podospora didyma]|uniref:C2H2-type domain-containing protein n=1 Tax=Podospora didyma TaxID=330526 RepID=A0AAE0NS62_9PEZI|nr:hypothetical protein B0H63DRAFT_520765 [Podospora didyma]
MSPSKKSAQVRFWNSSGPRKRQRAPNSAASSSSPTQTSEHCGSSKLTAMESAASPPLDEALPITATSTLPFMLAQKTFYDMSHCMTAVPRQLGFEYEDSTAEEFDFNITPEVLMEIDEGTASKYVGHEMSREFSNGSSSTQKTLDSGYGSPRRNSVVCHSLDSSPKLLVKHRVTPQPSVNLTHHLFQPTAIRSMGDWAAAAEKPNGLGPVDHDSAPVRPAVSSCPPSADMATNETPDLRSPLLSRTPSPWQDPENFEDGAPAEAYGRFLPWLANNMTSDRGISSSPFESEAGASPNRTHPDFDQHLDLTCTGIAQWHDVNANGSGQVRDHQATSTASGAGGEAYSGQLMSSSLTQNSARPSASSKRNREAPNDENSPDDDGPPDPKRPRTLQPSSPTKHPTRPRFACPFQKYDPIGSPFCCSPSSKNPDGGADTFSRLKSHIFRNHDPFLRCQRCWKAYISEAKLLAHGQDSACIKRATPTKYWITRDQQVEIKSLRFMGNSEENWYHLFSLLLPEVPEHGVGGYRSLSPYFAMPNAGPLTPSASLSSVTPSTSFSSGYQLAAGNSTRGSEPPSLPRETLAGPPAFFPSGEAIPDFNITPISINDELGELDATLPFNVPDFLEATDSPADNNHNQITWPMERDNQDEYEPPIIGIDRGGLEHTTTADLQESQAIGMHDVNLQARAVNSTRLRSTEFLILDNQRLARSMGQLREQNTRLRGEVGMLRGQVETLQARLGPLEQQLEAVLYHPQTQAEVFGEILAAMNTLANINEALS